MCSMKKRLEVNGSLLTDATCATFKNVDRIPLFSSVNFSLLVRYMMQSMMTDVVRAVKHPRVLDVGCNNGAALHMHQSSAFQRPGRRALDYVGMDLYEPQLRQGEEHDWKLPNSRVHTVSFVHHDLTTTWPLEDESFDVVWYTEVIEHLPQAFAPFTLASAWDVTKPGGRMMLATPSSHDGSLVWPESHDAEFTRAEVREMLHDTGWTIEDEWAMDADFTWARQVLKRDHPDVFQMYEKLRKRVGPSLAKVAVQALVPEIGRDFIYMCRKEVRDVDRAMA